MDDQLIQDSNNNNNNGAGGAADGGGNSINDLNNNNNDSNNNNNNMNVNIGLNDKDVINDDVAKKIGSSTHTFGGIFGSIPLSPIPYGGQLYPTLPLFDANRYTKNASEENNGSKKDPYERHSSTRAAPYRATPHLDYQDRLELVEQIVSMFPLLEKDGKVYSILERNAWSVEKSIPELQKRHDQQELIAEKVKKMLPSNLDGGNGETMNDSQEMSESISISVSDSMSYEDDEDEELLGEEEEAETNEANFPKLNEDIKTLQDIFGNTYQEYDLKSYYVMCGGNMELVIDQLVSEQNQATKAEAKPNVQPSSPRKPLTSRLSEEEKRAIQLQLIEEQEKLEKNFEHKKREKESSHPNKKTYSQQEILRELTELFGSKVDQGVIEWVAYSCDYNLGNCVTQLIDLKNNTLMNKAQAAAAAFKPHLDPAIQNKLQNGISELLGAMAPKSEDQMADTTTPTTLTSQVSFDSFITDVQSKLTVPHSDTTTTTTNTKSPSLWGTNTAQSNNLNIDKSSDHK